VTVGSVSEFGGGTGFLVFRYNVDGSLDRTFGPNHDGQVLTAFTQPAAATAVAQESDGKILVAGYAAAAIDGSVDFALARYTTDGSLDTSFGTGGVVTTSFGSLSTGAMDVATSIAVDWAGRIVLGGYTGSRMTSNRIGDSSLDDFALARYTANGSLDRTFGTGGLVVTAFVGTAESIIDSVALDAKDRIVAAGYTFGGEDRNGFPARRFALARYTTSGSLDKTFGKGGEVTTNVVAGNDDTANAVVIQPDGKIVAAGWSFNSSTSTLYFALTRYTTGGSLDKAFGTGGTVVTNFGNNGASGIDALTLDTQGRIVAAGFTLPGFSHNPSNTTASFAVARYTSNGSLDNTFGAGGEVGTGFRSGAVSAQGIARGQNGQLVVVGGGAAPSGLGNGTPGDFSLARYNANGTLDKTFGNAGQVSTLTAPLNSTFDAFATEPDGKVIVVGGLSSGSDNSGILRLNKDGSLDTTFGSGGEVITQLSLAGATVVVVVQPDGKILVVTTSATFGNQASGYVSLLRFNANGSVDSSFGVDGETLSAALPGHVPQSTGSVTVAGVVVQPDGKIVVAAGTGSLDLVRFNKDGSLDTGFGSAHTGSIVTAFSETASSTLALQPDGKLVITGSVNGKLALTRFNADGSQDKTFGTAGVVHTSLAVIGVAGVVVQSGGKIVVGGTATTQKDFFVARFNTNGSLDKTFGTGGETLTNFGGNDRARGIVIDSAGRIVLAGTEANAITGTGIYVARYTSNGQLDSHFGTGGKLITSFAGAAVGMVLEPQGTLVVAGKSKPAPNTHAIALAEYTTGS
jgi:uncharacterized delta-60 repeat protein